MKASKWITMAAVLTLSTSLAVAAPHGNKGERHGRGEGGQMGARFAEKLNLTAEQKQKIEDLQKSFREQNRPLFEASRQTFQQYREAKKAGDTARMEALKPQVDAQMTQVRQLRQAHMQTIVALLTPEQRAQLEAMKAERESRRDGDGMKKHRGHRRDGAGRE